MFGKLLKHELRHTARYHFLIITVSLIATAVMGISLLFEAESVLNIAMLPLVLIAFAVIGVTFISVIKNFYDTIFSRQGYLTMTLPVKGNQLLLSKILISFFWIIIGYIAAFLPFLFIFLHVKKQLDADNMTDELVQSLQLYFPSGGSLTAMIFFFVLGSLIYILSYVSYVYFSVTMANTRLLSKHPKLFGFGVFFLVSRITPTLSSLTQKIFNLNFVIGEERVFFTFKDISEINEYVYNIYSVNDYVSETIVAIALLFATAYFIQHKINIK